MTFSIWGISRDTGEWVRCYTFDDEDTARYVASQRKGLWPLQLRNDSLPEEKRIQTRGKRNVIQTYV